MQLRSLPLNPNPSRFPSSRHPHRLRHPPEAVTTHRWSFSRPSNWDFLHYTFIKKGREGRIFPENEKEVFFRTPFSG
jgi:hypothetical protein